MSTISGNINDNECNIPISDKGIVIYYSDRCIYCIKAKSMLKNIGIDYKSIDIVGNRDLQIDLYYKTRQSTIPYVFIDGKFIGGYTDLKMLKDDGHLDRFKRNN
ncbi:MAG TPA: glutaredoxin [Candidatus Megaira endosymbiont of Hartmannula sinica]|nr:glutaredoxin [Candidatus Megaera endosymbiont of Hartmannula sinica]